LQYGQALKFPYSLAQTLELFVRFDALNRPGIAGDRIP
jgi:hypothetical protein